MKYLGNIIAGIGFVGMILGFSSYDTNPVICGAVGVIGTLLIWIGYNVDKGWTFICSKGRTEISHRYTFNTTCSRHYRPLV